MRDRLGPIPGQLLQSFDLADEYDCEHAKDSVSNTNCFSKGTISSTYMNGITAHIDRRFGSELA